MDALERMAWDLEDAQNKRFKKARNKAAFFDTEEQEIFDTIKLFRKYSRTYHPDNER